MSGDGTTAKEATVGGGAEPQYVRAKTSVWWDIENCQVPKGCDPHGIAQNISSALVKINYCGPVSICAYGDTNRIPSSVQQALSSTGIALNHVPAGVKDASDKKILVDMLFWAVDNPAPANYLLISGDRDFSNALHQLRMRRYNILLAQPIKASPALVAAAKSVWLWTSLVDGGSPLLGGESTQVNNMFNSEFSQNPNSDSTQLNPTANFSSGISSWGNQKSFNTGRFGDGKFRSNYVRKNPNQPIMTRTSSAPVGIQEIKNDDYSRQPGNASDKQFKKAPHEFFIATEPTVSASRSAPSFFPEDVDNSGNNGLTFEEKPRNLYPLPRPTFVPDNMFTPYSHSSGTDSVPWRPDISKLSSAPLSNVHYSQNTPNFRERIEFPSFTSQNGLLKGQPYCHDPPNTMFSGSSMIPPLSSTSVVHSAASSNGIRGTPGCSQSSEFAQGLVGVVLLALNTLKVEKIMPTEANITECIRFGMPRHRNAEVRKALDCAVEQHMVVKQNLGAVQMYVGKNEKLWKCVNPIGSNVNQFPKATWDAIQNFLISAAGRSAIMASQCRYEAALILRNACLKELALGDVLQILNMIITIKRWILVHQSGWQPITFTLAETNTVSGP